jgi:protein SCO1/2
LPQARALKDIHLESVNHSPYTLKDIRGHWNLIFVGYTNCPDVCPNTLSVLGQVDQLMEEQGLAPPRVIFISIDPERDKPELIDQYVKYFNEKFIGVTGSKQALDSVAAQLSVVYTKAPGADGTMTGDNYLMDHSSSIILLNPDAQVQAILTAPHTPMQIIDSIVRTQVYYYE